MDFERYNRQILLPEIGIEGQNKLQNAKVLIVGVGGLGSAVLPYLVASGIGEIGIIDEDTVEISNLQRQVIYNTDALGSSKVFEAKKMALSLNPLVKINAIAEKLNPENALFLFEQYDIIVDGTDNLFTKYLIDDACAVCHKPFVYGAVFKFEGQVSVFNFQDGPTYRCVFPNEKNDVTNCNESGVLGVSVGIIGMLQANEVLKIILKIGQVLSSKLLVYNILNNEQQLFHISNSKTKAINQAFFDNKYKINKELEIKAEIAFTKKSNSNIIWLDVRNFKEEPKIAVEYYLQIPLSTLEANLHLLDVEKEIFVFCQSGIRSKLAVDILKKYQFKKVKSINSGAIQLANLLEKEIYNFIKE